MAIKQHLQAFLTEHASAGTDRLTIAYSGGMDSHVLLHLLATDDTVRRHYRLTAAYVDHDLQTPSAAWGVHCAQVCQTLGLPFTVLKVDARPESGESPEAAARRARYAALAAHLEPNAALLTAHHCDDQAETLLLQLLRGAGPHGLAAMPAVARLGNGWLLRPLLVIEHSELLAYARAHHLHWIEDTSNSDSCFDRNYLRHRVWPLLTERWPAAQRNLARSAQLCAETADWLDAEAASDLARSAVAGHANALRLTTLRKLSEVRQRNLLRYWLRQLGLAIPDRRQLHHALHDLLTARPDGQPCARWPGTEVRRYHDALYAMRPLPPHNPRQTAIWQATANGWPILNLPGIGSLRLEKSWGVGLRAAALTGGSLSVRFRTGGERFHPAGRRHTQELKKLLQEAGIPPWQRDRLPLLYRDTQLLAVVGLGIAAEQAAAFDEWGWQPLLRVDG